MTTISAIVAAYVLTGIHYVWRDVRADIVSQPAYAREYSVRGRISPLMIAALSWFPATIFASTIPGTRLRHLKREATSWLLFGILVCAGLFWGNS
jgi:hypothetical protein